MSAAAARLGRSANILQEQEEEENCVLEAFITTLLACLTAMELEQTTDPTHLKLLLLKEVHWIVHNIVLGWKVVSKWFFIVAPLNVKYQLTIEIKVVGTI